MLIVSKKYLSNISRVCWLKLVVGNSIVQVKYLTSGFRSNLPWYYHCSMVSLKNTFKFECIAHADWDNLSKISN